MSFIKNSLGTFATLAITTIIGLAWGIITARVLQPDGVGILTIALLYPIFFFTIGHLTFNVGTMHYLGKREYPLENFVANSILVSLVMGVLLYFVFVVTLPLFQDTIYKGVDTNYLMVTFLIVPFYLLMYQLQGILQGIGKIKEFNVINIVRAGIGIISLIVLVVLLKFSIMGAVIAFVAGYFSAMVITFYYIVKLTKGKWLLNLELLWNTFRDSGKMHIASIATFLYGYVGLMIANYYLSSSEVGYLSVAMTCALFLVLIPQAVQTVLYSVTNAASENNAISVSLKVCRNTVFWTAISAIIFALVGKYVILLFAGEAYLPAIKPFFILLIGLVMFAVAQVIVTLWVRKGWFWLIAVSGVSLGIISILLNLWLIPKLGIVGSAVASSLTYLVGFLTVVGVHFVKVDRNIWKLFILQVEDFRDYGRILKRGFVNA